MPELPEVETIRADVSDQILNKTILKVDVFRESVIKEPAIKAFKAKLKNAEVTAVLRKAKALVVEFDNGLDLVVHLRMTGGLVYVDKNENVDTQDWLRTNGKDVVEVSLIEEVRRFSRVCFRLDDGSMLVYTDRRCLGELRLIKDHKELNFFKTLAKEPFYLNKKEFYDNLQKRKSVIKSLLLNQTFIAGVGNIYAVEALFRAKISPFRIANTLTLEESGLLLKEIKNVLKLGIKFRGSSIDSYRDGSGNKGSMSDKHLVYAKEGQDCLVCGTAIKKDNIAGRGTCYCPQCQK